MTELLYLEDSYATEFTAKVIKADGTEVVLDRTLFYPTGGGQPHDTGVLKKGDEQYKVIGCRKGDEGVVHVLEKEGLREGDEVEGTIDWERRYRLMRCHSAAHIVSYVVEKETGAKITGNQLGEEKGRIDYNLPDFDREALPGYIDKANEIIKKGLPMKVSAVSVEEAKNMPNLFKLAAKMPPEVEEIRVVSIGDLDDQADGGTHVKTTDEVGTITLGKVENEGKSNRRMYFWIE